MQNVERLRTEERKWRQGSVDANRDGDAERCVLFDRMASRYALAAGIARLIGYTSTITTAPPEAQEPAGNALFDDAAMMRAAGSALNNLMDTLENHL